MARPSVLSLMPPPLRPGDCVKPSVIRLRSDWGLCIHPTVSNICVMWRTMCMLRERRINALICHKRGRILAIRCAEITMRPRTHLAVQPLGAADVCAPHLAKGLCSHSDPACHRLA
ncbi:hypothetical protein NQZ68_003526 [Dissostichus eleginoides]|nr:hypothetical protein NQZ68_003526 [Dissostichus eleginoides]